MITTLPDRTAHSPDSRLYNSDFSGRQLLQGSALPPKAWTNSWGPDNRYDAHGKLFSFALAISQQKQFDGLVHHNDNGLTSLTLTVTSLINFDSATHNYYYHFDSHGNVTSISDQGGAVAVRYLYDAWGNFTAAGDPEVIAANPFTYQGRYDTIWEGYHKKYYMGSRWYDPYQAQFITPDSQAAAPGTTDAPYAYAANDPVTLIDADGHAPKKSSAPVKVKAPVKKATPPRKPKPPKPAQKPRPPKPVVFHSKRTPRMTLVQKRRDEPGEANSGVSKDTLISHAIDVSNRTRQETPADFDGTGGHGPADGCSIPRFARPVVPDTYKKHVFNVACLYHDQCYKGYNHTKEACDTNIYFRARGECSMKVWIDYYKEHEGDDPQECFNNATQVYRGLKLAPYWVAYDKGQKWARAHNNWNYTVEDYLGTLPTFGVNE